MPQLARIAPDGRVSAEKGFPGHPSEPRYIYDFGFEGVQDAEWVALDNEGTNYDLPVSQVSGGFGRGRGYDTTAKAVTDRVCIANAGGAYYLEAEM